MTVEVRYQNDAIDEIVANNVNVHIERMSGDGWFMSIVEQDGKGHRFWFGSKNRRAHVEFRLSETVQF